MPGVFAWPTKGNLIFQFDTPRQISGIRLYVGEDAGSYGMIAYLGAEFGESGQTETGDATMTADAYNADFQPNAWVELSVPPDTETDYIELITESGAEFYEIEILASGPGPTPVKVTSWGELKASARAAISTDR